MPIFYMGKGHTNSDPQILMKHYQPAPYLLSQFLALLFFFLLYLRQVLRWSRWTLTSDLEVKFPLLEC